MGSVLFVDDEPWTLASHGRRLTSRGHEVQLANTVRQAEEILAMQPMDLVVLDINMPLQTIADLLRVVQEMGVAEILSDLKRHEKGGFELYRHLQQQGMRTRWVILSIDPEIEIRAQAPDLSFDCPFLRKGTDSPTKIYDT